MIFSIVDDISNIINNVEIFLNDTFSFLPSEIFTILSTAILIIIALYIYRLVR